MFFLWKIIKKVLDERLSKIKLQDFLPGFRAKRNRGIGIMKAKLIQQLSSVEQCPFCGIFIDLWKACNVMDSGLCLEILRDCGVGKKAL